MLDHCHSLSDTALPGFETSILVPDLPGLVAMDGRREKVREHFMNAGGEATADEEVLELVLYRAIPRREVATLAQRLLFTFGDFNGVVSARPSRLAEVQGVGTAVIRELKIVEAAAHKLARCKVMQREVLSNWDALLEYCQTRMAHLEVEQFRVLYLNRKNVLIADEAQGAGTVDHVPVYPREIVKRALELNASALILVHNHPSGDATPSPEDIAMTKTIQTAGETLGLILHDHLVIGKAQHVSLRAEGHI